MPKVAARAAVAVPALAALFFAAALAEARAARVRPHDTPVRPSARPLVRLPADSVRQLNVAIVLVTNSFNKVLTPAEVERVHEEVAEFYAFYQQHGAGKVDLRFSLVQIDRPIARRDIAEVSPNRYYLSRENVEAELSARGFRGRFDEVIALHAWSNANPDRALQAYGGGAVGPDGNFLGDAGFNSIPVMGRDPDTIGQVLIHEVLHNLDDMFSRSGMPDDFLNSDEMSRNMPQLLRERPGAFLPRYGDAEMLAFADRERQGREGYPWALQLVYYGWMLERTPKAAWDRLRYGRMVPAGAPAVRPLYAEVFTAIANDSTYVPVLMAETRRQGPGTRDQAADGRRLTADGLSLTADGRPLTVRSYTQADFDGTGIYSGTFHAGWLPLVPARVARGVGAGRAAVGAETLTVAIGGAAPAATGRRGRRGVPVATSVLVIRQRLASVVSEPLLVRYVDQDGGGRGGDISARVIQDRLGGDGPEVPGARLTVTGGAGLLSPGSHDVTLGAEAPGWYVHPAHVQVVARRGWRVSSDGPLTVSLGAPLTLNAFVREDRGRSDVAVEARIEGRRVPLAPTGDGRYSVTVPGDLAAGLHWARLAATAPSGEVVTDSLQVFVRPAGWIRPPASFSRDSAGAVRLRAQVTSRMGETIRGAHLPLVAIVGDVVTPLGEADSTGSYAAVAVPPAAATRVVLASLVGDLQRRVVELSGAGAPGHGGTGARADERSSGRADTRTGGRADTRTSGHAEGRTRGRADERTGGRADVVALPVYAAAVRMDRAPAIDGDLADWPRSAAQPVVLGPQSFVLTDTALYHGAADLSARIRLAWDDSTLYVAGAISDDSVTTGDAWDTDRVNLVFDMKHDTSPLTYASANPPLDQWQDDDYWLFWRFGQTSVRRFGKVNADPVPGARLATRRTAEGWTFEAAIPRTALPGYVPFVGQVSGLQVFVTDGDGERTATELMWSAKWPYPDGIAWRLAELGTLLYVDAPVP